MKQSLNTEKKKDLDQIAEWLNERIPDRQGVQKRARSFHLEKEISKGRVTEPRASACVGRTSVWRWWIRLF